MQRLDGYLKSLRQLQRISLEEYLADENIQAIVERRLQLAIQICLDIANYLIAHLRLAAPEELPNVFDILGREGIIPADLAHRMVGMVRFRNILVHNYLEIDAHRVYRHLSEDLDDFDRFARVIVERYLS